MRRRSGNGPVRAVIIVLAAVVLGGLAPAGCGDDGVGDPPTTTGSGPPTPTGYLDPAETVSVLLEILAADGWDEAAGITVEGQMALVALAEGADIETVSDYLRLGESGVGANFWAGFTQVVEEYLAGSIEDLRVVSRRAYEAGEKSFVDFGLASSTSPEGRTFKLTVVRSDDLLWRVDVIATFVDVLAYRLSETAEIARATRTEDAAAVSAELGRQVASLQAALTDPDLTEELNRGILSILVALQ